MSWTWWRWRDRERGTRVPLEEDADPHPRTGVCLLTLGFVAAAAIGGGIGSVITTVTLEPTTTTKIVAYRDPYGRKPDGTPTDTPANIYESLGRTCENGYTMGEVIVSMNLGKNGTQSDAFFALIDTLGEGENVTYRSNYTNMFSGYFTEQRLTEFHQAGVNEPANESFTGGITIESDCILVAEQVDLGEYTFFDNVASGRQITMPNAQVLWGLDRIDHRENRNNRFVFGSMTGEGVVVYVMDSGIRIDHQEFAGGPNDGSRAEGGFAPRCPRVRRVICGGTVGYEGVIGTGQFQAPTTCSAHGTSVASIIAGQTFGVAKRATVVSVQVLNCDGRGSMSAVITGFEWIVRNHQERGKPPAIITFAISTTSGSDAINKEANIAVENGISVFNSAGNGGILECTRQLNNNPNTMTVGATTFRNNLTSFSNFGPCIQISAPGASVGGAAASSTTGGRRISGTSFSTPVVAGIAATILGANRDLSPADLYNRIKCWATRGELDTSWRAGMASKFAYFDTQMATQDCPS